MNKSWRITNLLGIDVYLHWTFLLLPVWVLLSSLSAGAGLVAAATSVAFVLAIFGCVLLHELGHALMARRYGIRTQDIILLPIGGVARLERMPERPSEELAVALAGPLVNVVIALAVFAGLVFSSGSAAPASAALVGGPFLANLMWANIALVIFNLIPAFPMDGGRVLRALLAMAMPYERATSIAARTGQSFAIAFGVIGFFTNWMLMLLAVFIYMAAAGERQMVGYNSRLRGYRVRDAMQRNFRVLPADAPLSDAVAELYSSDQEDFPVTSGPYFVGMLSRKEILSAAHKGEHHRPVAQLMQPISRTVDENAELSPTFAQMQASPRSCVPVTRAGQLVGILSLASLMRWLHLDPADGTAA